MSPTLTGVLALCAFVFSLLALVGAAITSVIVIGWKNSTHKIVQIPVEPTRFEYDQPKEVLDKLPHLPGADRPMTAEELDNFYDQE